MKHVVDVRATLGVTDAVRASERVALEHLRRVEVRL
jgi:hypothetical protein